MIAWDALRAGMRVHQSGLCARGCECNYGANIVWMCRCGQVGGAGSKVVILRVVLIGFFLSLWVGFVCVRDLLVFDSE